MLFVTRNLSLAIVTWLTLTSTECESNEHPSDDSTAIDRNLTGFESIEQTQPLWEIGAAGFVGEVPDYPASSERNLIGLAVPYVIYRGDIFRVGDGRGARAVVKEEKDWEINLSTGGSFPADSEANTAREGMAEIDFIFEFGPQLIYRIKDFDFSSGGNGRLNARLQTRSAFSTDFNSLTHRGYVFESELRYQQRGHFFPKSALAISLDVLFATEKFHDYFYQVSEPFASTNRPQFDAQPGYLGSELSINFSFPVTNNIRAFVGTELQLHHGAANEDSPLFEKNITHSVALGFIWRLYQSKQRANL